MKGEKVVCPRCGLFCALKREDGRVICMGNGSCRYDSVFKCKNKKEPSKGKLDIRRG